jgi:uncharacterized protein YmfQ (DUF2313 family)
MNQANQGGVVQPGNVPVVLVPPNQPIPIPEVGDAVDGEGAFHEAIAVTPNGEVIPLVQPPEEGQDGEEGGFLDVPKPQELPKRRVRFDEEWLNTMIAGRHPLTNYNNQQPQDIEGGIANQMTALTADEIAEIRRSFGPNIPVAVANDMLYRSVGEFTTARRLRVLQSGFVSDGSGAFDPLVHRRLQFINANGARLEQLVRAQNTTDPLFENYLDNPQGYLNYLRGNFATFDPQTRREHENSLSQLVKALDTLNSNAEQLAASNQETLLEKVNAQKTKIKEKIKQFESALEEDDNRRGLFETSFESYTNYKRRRTEQLADLHTLQALDGLTLEQLYEYLNEINQVQWSIMSNIGNVEKMMGQEASAEVREGREMLRNRYREFTINAGQSVQSFLSEMMAKMNSGIDDTQPLMKELKETMRQLVEKYDNSTESPGKIMSALTASMIDVFKKHANSNTRATLEEMKQTTEAFGQSMAAIWEILHNDNLSPQEITNHLVQFKKYYKQHHWGSKTAATIIHSLIKSKAVHGKKISDRLLYLEKEFKSSSDQIMAEYQKLADDRKNAKAKTEDEMLDASIRIQDLEFAGDRLRKELERAERDNAMYNEQIAQLRMRAQYSDNMQQLEDACDMVISEIGALNMLTGISESNTNDVVYTETAKRVVQARNRLVSINGFINQNLLVPNGITSLDELERGVQAMQDEIRKLNEAFERERGMLETAGLEIQARDEQIIGMHNEMGGMYQEMQSMNREMQANAERANTMTEAYQQTQEALQRTTEELRNTTEGANEAVQIASNTSNALKKVLEDSVKNLNSMANTYISSALSFYQSRHGDVMFTNDALVKYYDLKPYLDINDGQGILAAVIQRSNPSEFESALLKYQLYKRYNRAMSFPSTDARGMLVRYLASVYNTTDPGGDAMGALLDSVRNYQEVTDIPDGYRQMFESMAEVSPQVRNHYVQMTRLSSMVDFVNDPDTFVRMGSAESFQLLGPLFSQEGMGLDLLIDGSALAITREYMKRHRMSQDTSLIPEGDEGEASEDTVRDAYQNFLRCRRLIMSKASGNNYNIPVTEDLFNKLLPASGSGIMDAILEEMDRGMDASEPVRINPTPAIQSTAMVPMGASGSQQAVTFADADQVAPPEANSHLNSRLPMYQHVFENDFLGEDYDDSFSSVFMGMIQYSMEPNLNNNVAQMRMNQVSRRTDAQSAFAYRSGRRNLQ